MYIGIVMKKCKLCGKESARLGKHLIWCQSKHDFLNKYNLDKEKIQQEYDRLGSVQSFIKEYPGFTSTKYYNLFKDLGIDYSHKKSVNAKSTKDKRKKTSLKKYGSEHNFCKNHPSRQEWEKRLLKEEGITNVFQRESVKKKSLQTIIKKYESNSNRARFTQRGASVSKLNKWCYDILNQHNIYYQPEFRIAINDIKCYIYDIHINGKLIEINGDYWHGNPTIYKPTDIILKGSTKEILVKDKWKKDQKKLNFAKQKGFDILVVWEQEIKNNEKQTIDRIISYAKS